MNLFVRVVAPSGRDAELITAVLKQHDVPANIGTVASFVTDVENDIPLGPLLIAEEALTPAVVSALNQYITHQPSWSDLPILILTGGGRDATETSRLQAERLPLGSPVLLERPIRIASLASSVKAALRARMRQYEIRDTVAELNEERELLQAMLDNLPVGVVLAKASGEIVRGNRKLDEIVRHPLMRSPDIESHGDWMAFHGDGRRVTGEEFPLSRAIKAGHPLPPEDYLYQRGDGTQAWISLAAAPIFNAAGEITGGVVALSDIDQQKRSEQALIQSEKLAAVGRLAASISHEINNPLESVINLLYLARGRDDLPDEARSLLTLADQELSRVSQIVSHTLRFHRQSTNPRALSAKELLEPPLGLYASRLSNANIELVLDHREAPLVTCYEGEIRQVLNNLIGNAIDSMRLGGRLIVRTRNACSWKNGRSGLRITIADTGHGIEQKKLKQVFEAFFTTKGLNGTGLGLWISKGIVEKHFGSIRVFSKNTPGQSGTVFSLFLPSTPFQPKTQARTH